VLPDRVALSTRWPEHPASVSSTCGPTRKQASLSSGCGSLRIARSRASNASARSVEVSGDATTARRDVDGSALLAESLPVLLPYPPRPPSPRLSQHLRAPTRLAPSELVTAARP